MRTKAFILLLVLLLCPLKASAGSSWFFFWWSQPVTPIEKINYHDSSNPANDYTVEYKRSKDGKEIDITIKEKPIIYPDWSDHDPNKKSPELRRTNHIVDIYTGKATEQEQIAELKKDVYLIKAISEPTESVQLMVIRIDVNCIEYIKNPTEKVQLEAVRIDGDCIRFINNPSKEVQLEAVRNSRLAYWLIKSTNRIENINE